MSDKIDISPEAVEQLARDLPNSQWQAPNLHLARETLRALRARLEAVEAQYSLAVEGAQMLAERAERAEVRLEAVESLARGQGEQIEIQGNTIIRINDYAGEQQDRAERAEAALATARRDGIMSAHRLVEKRRLDYQIECGMYDSTTGQIEYPVNGEEWVCDLEDLEDAIRALANEAETSARGMPCPSR